MLIGVTAPAREKHDQGDTGYVFRGRIRSIWMGRSPSSLADPLARAEHRSRQRSNNIKLPRGRPSGNPVGLQAVTIPNARIESWSPTNGLRVHFPADFNVAADRVVERCQKAHNSYIKLSIDIPSKPRTFGPRKQKADDPVYQSNMLHGFLSQLAIHYGYTMGEIKEIMKDDVPEWPVEPRKVGKRMKLRPVSEADVSTVVEARAIEWCRMIAGEEGLVLKT